MLVIDQLLDFRIHPREVSFCRFKFVVLKRTSDIQQLVLNVSIPHIYLLVLLLFRRTRFILQFVATSAPPCSVSQHQQATISNRADYLH